MRLMGSKQIGVALAAIVAFTAAGGVAAQADSWKGHGNNGWQNNGGHNNGWHGNNGWGRSTVVIRQGYYAAPRAYYAPPPPVYYAPPPVYYAPPPPPPVYVAPTPLISLQFRL